MGFSWIWQSGPLPKSQTIWSNESKVWDKAFLWPSLSGYTLFCSPLFLKGGFKPATEEQKAENNCEGTENLLEEARLTRQACVARADGKKRASYKYIEENVST